MTVAHVVSSVKGTGAYGTGLVGTHAVSDALATTTFAAVLPVAALLSEQDAAISSALLDFLQLGIGGALLGVAGGWLISRIGFQIETSGELLLFVLVHILLAWSLSEWLGSSLPLAALVAGATAASVSAAPPLGAIVSYYKKYRTAFIPAVLWARRCFHSYG